MPPALGEAIAVLILAIPVFLAARSLWKGRKKGPSCGGDCSRCHGCGK